jgi:hypothetical protein
MHVTFWPGTRSLTPVDARLLAVADEVMTVKILDADGEPVTLTEGHEEEEVTLGVKPLGKRDTPRITLATGVTQDEAGLITLAFSALTTAIVDLLKLDDANATNDVTELLCEFDLIYTPFEGVPRQSFPALVTIICPVSLPSDIDPDTLPRKSWAISEDGTYIIFSLNGSVIGKVPLVIE